MCGIAGFWSNTVIDNKISLIKSMTDSIAHRGPNGEGHWMSKDQNITLGHRRLSIIDLSNNGNQPMHFMDRYSITFNGEIYNYIEIREVLLHKGYVFRTESDTEVILAAYHEWKDKCLSKFDGMFAIVIYDNEAKQLFCARDRFGEKPFYYSFYNGCFVFASEMKAIWAFGVPKEPSNKMLYSYLAEDLVENPLDQRETFFNNIYKLKSSHYFIYKGEKSINQLNYWKIDLIKASQIDASQISNHFLGLLETSLKRRLRSDVSVGSSLSGGLDSSSIVALISKFSKSNHTFSARFKNFKKDEGKFIDIVTSRFKTNHHNVYVNENQLMMELDKLIWHQEEPFQTGSIYAQWCVYQEARRNNIIVMLDGQGADEYLCGYDKDFKSYLKEIRHNIKFANSFKSQIKNNHHYDVSLSKKDQLFLKSPRFYKFLAQSSKIVLDKAPMGISKEFHQSFHSKQSHFIEFSDLKQTLLYEMTNQGLEKLLKFADRNSMAHSVEVRLPFLYHELVEFIFSLNSSYFLKDGWSKSILRNAVEDLLPNEIVRRKDKIGFEAPQNDWMDNSLFSEIYKESFDYLYKNKMITTDYSNKWKIVIAAKFLKGS
jgi:asparagine synthase (glutamine-hydrolysing)